jgi:hypothetical protein
MVMDVLLGFVHLCNTYKMILQQPRIVIHLAIHPFSSLQMLHKLYFCMLLQSPQIHDVIVLHKVRFAYAVIDRYNYNGCGNITRKPTNRLKGNDLQGSQ